MARPGTVSEKSKGDTETKRHQDIIIKQREEKKNGSD